LLVISRRQRRSGHQESNRRAEMRVGIVKEFGDERVVVEQLLDDAALDPLASAMDKAQLSQACLVCGVDIVVNDRGDVFRDKGVKVETAVDGERDRIVFRHG